MRRVIAIVLAGACLAGCSSSWFSSPPPAASSAAAASSFDLFKPPVLVVQLQIDSVPQGAEAVTSLGARCRTPCEIPMTDPVADFSVSFTRNDYLPVTVPVKVSVVAAGFWNWGGAIINPNPVVVELQPVPPPPPPPRRKMKPRPPGPPKAAAAPPAAGSPFPAPPVR